ncbi:MAG: hypothetical protein R2881_02255 [Eubacteriales bacterium]
MNPNRMLRFGSAGEDAARKNSACSPLGCYAPHITAISTSRFGSDTRNRQAELSGQETRSPRTALFHSITWSALFPEDAAVAPQPRGEIPANIGETAAGLIASTLEGASDRRRDIVLDALRFAYDSTLPRDYPTSLYIRGGNLYNTDLTPNDHARPHPVRCAASAGILRRWSAGDDGGGGSGELAITGADCSGGVVDCYGTLAWW